MRAIFLGTTGWFDTAKTGSTPCVLLDTEKYYVVLDAGFGFAKLDKYLKADKPVFLFLSHFHLDHTCGLHTLPKFRFKQPLTILAGEGAKKILGGIVSHPFMASFRELRFRVKIVELKSGDYKAPFKFFCRPLKHVDPILGFRFCLDDKVIAYCTDTAICPNDRLLAQGADLLIHECSFLPGVNSAWGHANPAQVATLALEAGVKKLVLTHFDANSYKTLAQRKMAEREARKIFLKTVAAKDDWKLEI